VIQRCVQSVNTKDVGVQLLQVRNVSLTGLNVSQGVHELLGVGSVLGVSLVGDTSHQELGAIVGVEEFVTDDFNGRQISSDSTRNGGCRDKRFEQHGGPANGREEARFKTKKRKKKRALKTCGSKKAV